MRVLGLDPGSRRTGYGVLELTAGSPRYVEHGVLPIDVDAPMEVRLAALSHAIAGLIDRHRPDAAAIETVFTGKNMRSAIVLAQARGVLLAQLGLRAIPVFEYQPAVIKTTLTGFGRAEKGQIQTMVRLLLKLPELPAADSADALAVAICHLRTARWATLARRV